MPTIRLLEKTQIMFSDIPFYQLAIAMVRRTDQTTLYLLRQSCSSTLIFNYFNNIEEHLS